MKFLMIFMGLSILNVIFSTVRSIITIKGNSKVAAALVSGGYYAFYNIMLIYIVADFPLWQKCLITFICNVIGVYLVKWGEEKAEKEKLWKVEATILVENEKKVIDLLTDSKISFNYIRGIGNYTIFNIFCETKEQSQAVKEILKVYKVKYFVSESKNLE